jgi:L-lactate dehydrogenase (cytochrome)
MQTAPRCCRRSLARALSTSAQSPNASRSAQRGPYLSLLALATSGSLLYLYSQKKPLLAEANAPQTNRSKPDLQSNPKNGLITAEELSLHVHKENCWVALNGVVYDVTDWVPNHPGGPDLLLSAGGKDVSAAFRKFHPNGTLEMVGGVDPSAKLQSADTTVLDEEGAEKRRKELPDVDTIPNLSTFERLAKEVLTEDSRGYAYISSVADDGYSQLL